MRSFEFGVPRGRELGMLLLAAAWSSGLLGCAGLGPRPEVGISPLRISDHLYEGDAPRRASTQLVVMGLNADLSRDSHRALGHYERAIGLDANNPYAFLALARHLAESGDGVQGEVFVERAQSLFAAEQTLTPSVRVHLVGLKGQLGASMSPPRENSEAQRAEAARDAADIWSDGRLSADELL